MVSHIKGRIQTEGVWEKAAENIWTYQEGRKYQEVEGNCITMNFTICAPYQILVGQSNWGGCDGKGVYSMHGGVEECL